MSNLFSSCMDLRYDLHKNTLFTGFRQEPWNQRRHKQSRPACFVFSQTLKTTQTKTITTDLFGSSKGLTTCTKVGLSNSSLLRLACSRCTGCRWLQRMLYGSARTLHGLLSASIKHKDTAVGSFLICNCIFLWWWLSLIQFTCENTQKDISKPFLLLSESCLHPEVLLLPETSHPFKSSLMKIFQLFFFLQFIMFPLPPSGCSGTVFCVPVDQEGR